MALSRLETLSISPLRNLCNVEAQLGIEGVLV